MGSLESQKKALDKFRAKVGKMIIAAYEVSAAWDTLIHSWDASGARTAEEYPFDKDFDMMLILMERWSDKLETIQVGGVLDWTPEE